MLTQFNTIFTVDIKRLVTLVLQSDGLVKDQTVRTDFLRWHSVHALVVFITLNIVLELAVFIVGAHEFLGIWNESTCMD